jgi:hypothetical protein
MVLVVNLTSLGVDMSVITKRAKTPAELSVEAGRAEIETAKITAKADAFVQTFIAMTPAQVSTYVDVNVTDLASARLLLKRLSIMMLFLAKQAYK